MIGFCPMFLQKKPLNRISGNDKNYQQKDRYYKFVDMTDMAKRTIITAITDTTIKAIAITTFKVMIRVSSQHTPQNNTMPKMNLTTVPVRRTPDPALFRLLSLPLCMSGFISI